MFPWPVGKALLLLSRLTFMNVVDGSYTVLFPAAAPEVRKESERYKGAYLIPIAKLGEPSPLAQNEELAQELWDTTERFMQEWGLH